MERILVSACLLGVACRYDGESRSYPCMECLPDKYVLIPFCPEEAGGLPTPRIPAEILNGRVITKDGRDVTENYQRGALAALEKAESEGITLAILKSKSPSCGSSGVYDGTFSHTLRAGRGVTAQLFFEKGIAVISEEEIGKNLL